MKKPRLFQFAEPDRPASLKEIRNVERSVGTTLAKSYRQFLQEFGGGCFGLLTVFSADPTSEWYLPNRVRATRELLPKELLTISDDFAGGFYALKVQDGKAQERVYYWNMDGGATPTEFNLVIDFIARYAYEPA
jgi:hypothetical protein